MPVVAQVWVTASVRADYDGSDSRHCAGHDDTRLRLGHPDVRKLVAPQRV